jgi:hypothetical protein
MKKIIILFIFLNIILSCSKENETTNPIVGEWKLTNIKNSYGEEIATPCEIEFNKFILKNDKIFIWKSGVFYDFGGGCTEYINQPYKWEIRNDSLFLTNNNDSKTIFRISLNNNVLKSKLLGFIEPNGLSQFVSDESLISEYWYSKN